MSLINDMLRNLERRQATGGAGEESTLAGLAPCRTDAERQGARRRLRLLLAGTGILAGGLIALALLATAPGPRGPESPGGDLQAAAPAPALEPAARSWLATGDTPAVSAGPGPEIPAMPAAPARLEKVLVEPGPEQTRVRFRLSRSTGHAIDDHGEQGWLHVVLEDTVLATELPGLELRDTPIRVIEANGGSENLTLRLGLRSAVHARSEVLQGGGPAELVLDLFAAPSRPRTPPAPAGEQESPRPTPSREQEVTQAAPAREQGSPGPAPAPGHPEKAGAPPAAPDRTGSASKAGPVRREAGGSAPAPAAPPRRAAGEKHPAGAEPPPAEVPAARASFAARPPAPGPEARIQKTRAREPTPAEQADRLYAQGLRLARAGHGEAAVDRLDAALALAPDHVGAREQLAATLLALGRTGETSRVLTEGLALQPRHAPFARLQARILTDRNAFQEALDVLRHAAPPITEDPEYHAFIAALYQRTGEHAQAADIYGQVLKERSDAAVWWMGLGISLEGERQDREALEAYRRAATLGSLDPESKHYVDRRIRALQGNP